MFSSALGLAPNFPKCQIVLVHARLEEPLQDFLNDLGPPFHLIEIACCLKYLGIASGLGAEVVALRECVAKLQKRTQEI
eukprot:8133762-Pyramimonas_sp.AAC.1